MKEISCFYEQCEWLLGIFNKHSRLSIFGFFQIAFIIKYLGSTMNNWTLDEDWTISRNQGRKTNT